MKKPFRFRTTRGLKLSFALISLVLHTALGFGVDGQAGQHPKSFHPKPRFDSNAPPSAGLATWNGTFTYQGQTNAFTMVGSDPSSSNVTTTVPVFIIPLQVVLSQGTKTKTFNPTHKLPSGNTVIQQTAASPVFKNVDWVLGGTDIGSTQYVDAYQRGSFWTNVMTNKAYHVRLGSPHLLPTITVDVPANEGTVGTSTIGPPGLLGIINMEWFFQQAPTWIAANPSITPSSFALFVMYNTYLSSTADFGGCCIGGFHAAYGNESTPQTYAVFAFMDQSATTQVFSTDVSILSHEIGEWYDDPYITNTQGACGGILEVGDPLEGTNDFGYFVQTLGGYDYHLADLVFLQYFGQTPSTSVNNWWSFNNYPVTSVCEFGE